MKKRLIRVTLILMGLIAALILGVVVAYRLQNRTNGTLVSSGVERSYLLYAPESYDPAVPTPLVITLHGFVQWPAHQMEISHWNDVADQHGFIVVYPSGTGFPLRWDSGYTGSRDTGPSEDVQFIEDLIDKLEREYNIDPSRIYVNGLSNGGGMSFVLSCELSERIAAVGLVAGAYMYTWDECRPARPVPAIVFHGTADTLVPYEGGEAGPSDRQLPAIPEWIDTLAQRNGCDEAALELPAQGDVSGVEYANCDADVVFYTIAGGGHAWPGGGELVGYTTQDIDATQVMWDFFMGHPLPGG